MISFCLCGVFREPAANKLLMVKRKRVPFLGLSLFCFLLFASSHHFVSTKPVCFPFALLKSFA